jgi:hypothetical protein
VLDLALTGKREATRQNNARRLAEALEGPVGPFGSLIASYERSLEDVAESRDFNVAYLLAAQAIDHLKGTVKRVVNLSDEIKAQRAALFPITSDFNAQIESLPEPMRATIGSDAIGRLLAVSVAAERWVEEMRILEGALDERRGRGTENSAARRSSRRKTRESTELSNAAVAARKLRMSNPMRDPSLDDIAKASGIKKSRLQKMRLARILAPSNLREGSQRRR